MVIFTHFNYSASVFSKSVFLLIFISGMLLPAYTQASEIEPHASAQFDRPLQLPLNTIEEPIDSILVAYHAVNDARRYDHRKYLLATTLIVSPFLFAITIATAVPLVLYLLIFWLLTRAPSEKNLHMPKNEFSDNEYYRETYINEVIKIRNQKVLAGLLLGGLAVVSMLVVLFATWWF